MDIAQYYVFLTRNRFHTQRYSPIDKKIHHSWIIMYLCSFVFKLDSMMVSYLFCLSYWCGGFISYLVHISPAIFHPELPGKSKKYFLFMLFSIFYPSFQFSYFISHKWDFQNRNNTQLSFIFFFSLENSLRTVIKNDRRKIILKICQSLFSTRFLLMVHFFNISCYIFSLITC